MQSDHESAIADELVESDASTADDSEAEKAQTTFMENQSIQLSKEEREQIIQYVHDLKIKEKRGKALQELSKKREYF